VIIGGSIVEAIDWSQDQLRCTRPEAERALFSLMEQNLIVEAEDGFGYPDDEDQDKLLKKLHNAKGSAGVQLRIHAGHGPLRRSMLHQTTAHGEHAHLKHEHARRERRRRQRLGQSDAAEGMLAANDEANPDALS
jgi:hypothetical protein